MQSKDSYIYSVIDLGTNTCLLLIGCIKNYQLEKIFEAQEIPRLGKDLFKTENIAEESFDRVLNVIKNYIKISKKYDSEKVFIFGTSALRDAKNSKEFIEFIKVETGLMTRVLSGQEEARYGFDGAVYDLDESNDYAVLDIGGGSTEISYYDSDKFISVSIDIGSVRLFENFLKEGITKNNILKAKEFILEKLQNVSFENISNKILVGIAGTITTLSAIKNSLFEFEENKIHLDVLNKTDIEKIFNKLLSMSNEQRLKLGNFMKGRSDIIVSGGLIAIEIMNRYRFDHLIVSTKGLRYGLLLNINDFK